MAQPHPASRGATHARRYPAAKRTTQPPATISRIAVGVDGHPEGNDAVALGKMIADVMHADLMLVAVHPDPLVVGSSRHGPERRVRIGKRTRSCWAVTSALAIAPPGIHGEPR